MINKNELRVGNWVTHDDFSRPIQWQAKSFMHDENYIKSSPILLTEEILVQAGFQLHTTTNVKSIWTETTEYTYSYNDLITVDYRPDAPVKFYLKRCNVGVDYLHQLQNIIFYVTGEELIVHI